MKERKGQEVRAAKMGASIHCPFQALPSTPPTLCSKSHFLFLCDKPCRFPLKAWQCSIVWALRPSEQHPDLAGGFTQNLNCVSIFSGSAPAQLCLGRHEGNRVVAGKSSCFLLVYVREYSPQVKHTGRAILSRLGFHV